MTSISQVFVERHASLYTRSQSRAASMPTSKTASSASPQYNLPLQRIAPCEGRPHLFPWKSVIQSTFSDSDLQLLVSNDGLAASKLFIWVHFFSEIRAKLLRLDLLGAREREANKTKGGRRLRGEGRSSFIAKLLRTSSLEAARPGGQQWK